MDASAERREHRVIQQRRPAEGQEDSMNDQPHTEPTERLEPPTPPPDDGPRRLTRSRRDRMVAGVAGGLGRYFAVDPVIFRIGFAVSIFFGGLGVLAYAVLFLFVPSEPAEGEEEAVAPIQRSGWLRVALGVVVVLAAMSAIGSLVFWDGNWGDRFWGIGWLAIVALLAAAAYSYLRDRDRPVRGGALLAAIALGFLAAIGLGILALASAFAGATGSGAVVAGVVIVIGLMLIVAAFRGGARWLIAPALALAVPLALVSAADVSFGGGVGQRDYAPTSPAAIPDDGYELGIGRIVVDLRGLDWQPTSVVHADIDLGIGQAIVAVPENVCVSAVAETKAGDLDIAGSDSDGFDVFTDGVGPTPATPRLELDAEVDVGQLRVLNDNDVDVEEGHFHRGEIDVADSAMRDLQERACAS